MRVLILMTLFVAATGLSNSELEKLIVDEVTDEIADEAEIQRLLAQEDDELDSEEEILPIEAIAYDMDVLPPRKKMSSSDEQDMDVLPPRKKMSSSDEQNEDTKEEPWLASDEGKTADYWETLYDVSDEEQEMRNNQAIMQASNDVMDDIMDDITNEHNWEDRIENADTLRKKIDEFY